MFGHLSRLITLKMEMFGQILDKFEIKPTVFSGETYMRSEKRRIRNDALDFGQRPGR